MQQSSVWSRLGQIALKYPFEAGLGYIKLGNGITHAKEWKPFFTDLATWITVFSEGDWWRYPRSEFYHARAAFIAVMRSIWVSSLDHREKFTDETEESWTLALSALSTVWQKFKLTPSSDFPQLLRLARCTISASLSSSWEYFVGKQDPPEPFRSQLGKSLIEFVSKTRNQIPVATSELNQDISHDNRPALERLVELLETVGHAILTEYGPGGGEIQLEGSHKKYQDSDDLAKLLLAELDALQKIDNV
jgi:hypothetical protein